MTLGKQSNQGKKKYMGIPGNDVAKTGALVSRFAKVIKGFGLSGKMVKWWSFKR